jgi:hypothetical protein
MAERRVAGAGLDIADALRRGLDITFPSVDAEFGAQ